MEVFVQNSSIYCIFRLPSVTDRFNLNNQFPDQICYSDTPWEVWPKNSWGKIRLIAFFARPIFALDHFWHLIYFDFDLLIVWWPNQKRPWNTAAQHTALESIGGTCCQECLECYARCSRDQGRGPALPPRNNSGHAGMFTFNLKHTNNLKLVKKLSPNYF